jgi:hypothetical protein
VAEHGGAADVLHRVGAGGDDRHADGGFDEPTQISVSGRSTFAGDPAATFTSTSGQVTIDVTLLGLLKVYHADIAYTVSASERRISGSGVLQNPVTGNTTTMTVDGANPLILVPATGATANACGYSIDGDVRLVAVGPLGTYASTWHSRRATPWSRSTPQPTPTAAAR